MLIIRNITKHTTEVFIENYNLFHDHFKKIEIVIVLRWNHSTKLIID
jgi:hypothetical protein